GFREAGSYWMAWPYLATYQFSADSPFITAHPIPGSPVDVIWDVYRRSVVPMALQGLAWEALHPGALVPAKATVAFGPVSEAGRPTLAFGLRRRGFPQWSDDGVVLRMDGAAAMAEPLPFHARLRPQSQELFGEDGATRSVEGNSAGEQEF